MNRLILLTLFVCFGAFSQPNKSYTIHSATASTVGLIGVMIPPPLSPLSEPVLRTYTSDFKKRYEIPYSYLLTNRWYPDAIQAAEVYLGVDGKLDRPVIIIEGYDPYNERDFSSYWNEYNMASVGQSILNTGRDIVFINNISGGSDIEMLATPLSLLINYFGDIAKDNGQQAAVIGVSMGGISSRIALSNIEKQGGEHNVSLYISYDAPHQGANIPIDIISQVDEIENRVDASVCGLISKCRDARNQLRHTQILWKSPAARQMLVTGNLSKSFYSKLKNQIGYPTNLRKVAFSNGSGLSQEQNGISENQRVLEYRVDYDGLIHGSDRTYTLKSHSLGSAYKGYFSYSSSFFDKAPGGTFDGFKQMSTQMRQSANVNILFDSGLQNHSFIPTVSALDLNTSNLKSFASASNSPFDEVYHAGNNNLSHTNLSYHKNSLLRELNLYH